MDKRCAVPVIMKTKKALKNQKGFTLIEIIVVLALLSLLASIAVPRYIDLEQNSEQRAIDAGISELNSRESLTWADLKISVAGYEDDAHLMLIVDYNIGTEYRWNPGHPLSTGGNLTYKGETVALNRSQSNTSEPAFWSR
jgi:prepilin-type N-terminal cleavage/methylation domain-containing protein